MAKRGKGDRAEYGSGSIYKNKDGSYTVAVRLKRGEKPIRRRAPDRPAAEALKAELNRLKHAGIDVVKATQPVEDFTAYWFPEVYLQRGRAERSQKHVLDMLELHILPVIGQRPLIDVDHAALQQLLNNLRRRSGKKPLSAQTVHHVYSVLKQVFGKALIMGLIERDPTIGLDLPEIVRSQKPALTIEQVRRLLDLVDAHPYAVAFHLMAELGLRLGEALAVRRSDFNQDFTEITIQTAISYHTHAKSTPKRESIRRLPVPPHLSARCRTQWSVVAASFQDSHFQHGGLLCPSETGAPVQSSNFEKVWNGYTTRRQRKKGLVERYYPGFRERAGLPEETTLHDLRRFLATTLEDLDVGQRTIGHILGHKAKNVTEVYIKRNMPTMRRALEKLEGVLWGEVEQEEETGI
jgi:integrase